MAIRNVVCRWYANGLAFSFDFIADLSNHMVLQSGMPRLGRESYFFGGHSGCVIVSIQFDRSRNHLSEFWFNRAPAAYIIHFVNQLEPPATSAAAPVERHVFIVGRTVSQIIMFLGLVPNWSSHKHCNMTMVTLGISGVLIVSSIVVVQTKLNLSIYAYIRLRWDILLMSGTWWS